MNSPRAPRRTLWCWIVATALVVTTLQAVGSGPAAADDDPIKVHIESPPITGGTGAEETLRVVENIGTGKITVTNPGGTAPTTQQCVRNVANLSFCLGTSDQLVYPNDTNLGPVSITNAPTQNEGMPGTDLDWIIDEAVSSVAQVHGVRADDLVRSYARPEIRAYVAMRINDILNKKLYGQPMSQQETTAYDALEAIYKARLVNKAKGALREFDLWSKNPCLYPVPDPPPGSGLPYVANDVATSQACSAVSGFTGTFQFTKGTPPVEVFDAWAAYRNPSPLLVHGKDPNVVRMLGDTMDNYVTLGSLATALATASVTGATISALNLALVHIWYADASLNGVITWTLAAGGIASVVAAVVIAALIAGMAIWKIVEDEKPGIEIRRRVTEAIAIDDPFGIDARQADYAGLDYSTLEEPATGQPALIHETDFARQLATNTYEWMMFDGDGDVVADPISGWNSAGATQPDDLKLIDDGGDVRDPLVVLAPDGTIDPSNGREVSGYLVKVANGWLLVSTRYLGDPTPGPWEPRLNLRYQRADGSPAMMSLWRDLEPGQPEQTKFLHTYPAGDELDPVVSDEWTLKSLGGQVRTVHLGPSEPVLPEASVVPSIEGNLVADNLVELQANLSESAQGGGGDYTWKVQRLDESGDVAENIAVPAGNLTGFHKRFSTPGRYRAMVTYEDSTPTEISASGRIEFTIQPPQPELIAASIRDDRVLDGKLSLDLRLLQDTPTDTFDVTVEWADDARGNKAVEHYTVQCEDADTDTCDTGPLLTPPELPINSNWSASPTYRVADDQDYLPQVTVTITNSYGNTITRVFPVTGDHRPSYESMTPYAEMPAGKFSIVDVVEVFPSPLLTESQDLTVLPYVGAINAQLPEGIHPDIEERDGRWFLQLAGHPQADAIGSYTFYFPFEQEPIGKALRPAPALATLEIKAAADVGYRSVLRGTPTEALDRVYRNTYPDYHVQVAQVLADDEQEFSPFTGTVKCKLTAGPDVVFDEPCDADEPFPWPDERISDTLTASTYVESTNQPVSDDGPYSVDLVTKFLDPTLTQVTGPDGYVRFELTLRDQLNLPVPPPFGAKGYTVTCSEDGGAFHPCGDTGVIDLLLTPGDHTLAVKVVAPDGATTTEAATWNGGDVPADLFASITVLPVQPNDVQQGFTLAVERGGAAVAPPFGDKGYDVTCSQDGESFAACFDDGSLSLDREPGAHTLKVRVEASDGLTTTHEVEWTGKEVSAELSADLTVLPVQPDDVKQDFTLGIDRGGAVSPPFGQHGYEVTCSQDGGDYAACFDDGTLALDREPGEHKLAVRVEAADGVTTTDEVTWQGKTLPAELTASLTAVPAQPGDLKQHFTLGIDRGDEVATPFSEHGYTVTCSQDGGQYAACFDDGTLALDRVPGGHTLEVRVEAADDATVSRQTTWTVATPPTDLQVVVPAARKARGATVLVKAAGLLPGEFFAIRIDGRRVAVGDATPQGTVRTRVTIPARTELGLVPVKVRGATPHRVGQDTIRVVRPAGASRVPTAGAPVMDWIGW